MLAELWQTNWEKSSAELFTGDCAALYIYNGELSLYSNERQAGRGSGTVQYMDIVFQTISDFSPSEKTNCHCTLLKISPIKSGSRWRQSAHSVATQGRAAPGNFSVRVQWLAVQCCDSLQSRAQRFPDPPNTNKLNTNKFNTNKFNTNKFNTVTSSIQISSIL